MGYIQYSCAHGAQLKFDYLSPYILQEGESYDQIFADIERVIMPGVSCIITKYAC